MPSLRISRTVEASNLENALYSINKSHKQAMCSIREIHSFLGEIAYTTNDLATLPKRKQIIDSWFKK